MSLKLSPEETIRTGTRGVPNPISTSGQTQMNSTWGSKASDEFVLYDFSVVSAGIKANALADDNSWFRELRST